jgi:hypothetical protein
MKARVHGVTRKRTRRARLIGRNALDLPPQLLVLFLELRDPVGLRLDLVVRLLVRNNAPMQENKTEK